MVDDPSGPIEDQLQLARMIHAAAAEVAPGKDAALPLAVGQPKGRQAQDAAAQDPVGLPLQRLQFLLLSVFAGGGGGGGS